LVIAIHELKKLKLLLMEFDSLSAVISNAKPPSREALFLFFFAASRPGVKFFCETQDDN
jgi:hypothetical protein